MSGRRVDGMKETGDRRSSAGQRVHFEALVAVGGASSGTGFEAESVDVSREGMRLRAAYLPEIGDRLLCRFDGPGGEVLAEGEVCWRNEAARGGEFGLRFAGLPPATEEAVRSMCAALCAAGEPEPDAGQPGAADRPAEGRGARVRLHIEGLGSPMKARVRNGGHDSVEVGSNLEFLKVGRTLDIEDVDRGARREVTIDEVKVEIDPSTNIPQLLVTLRHEGAARPASAPAITATAAAAAPRAARAAAPREGAERRAPAPAPTPTRTTPAAESEADDVDLSPALEAREPEALSGSPPPVEAHPSPSQGGAGLRALGDKAAKASAAVAGKIGPAIAGAGSAMKGAMAGMVARIQQRRAEGAGHDGAADGEPRPKGTASAGGPRRRTAPPPAGALRSEGRRLVRDDEVDEAGDIPLPKPAMNRRAAAVGSFLGLAAVLTVFGVTRLAGLHSGAPDAPTPTASTAFPADTAAAIAAIASGAQPSAQPEVPGAQPGAPPGALAANVPLFGATPLSTTEPVPPPAPPPDPAAAGLAAAAAGTAAPGPGAAVDPSLAPGLAAADPSLAPGPGTAEPGEEPSLGGAGDIDGDPKAWGQGNVKNPVVLKLKMDGPIEQLNGAAGAMGFTVSLPNRRALSSGSDLARKDKRIASLRVVNTPTGSEVTVQFKDGVPPYLARAKGNRLEIALGNEHAPSKVAAKSKKAKTSKDSKKEDKGKKQKKGGKDKDKKHSHGHH